MMKIAALFLLAFHFCFAGAVWAADRVASAKAGDCAACHGDAKVLPEGHVDTKDLALADCRACHEKTGPTSLRGKLPGFHAHQLAGVGCAKCHEDPAKAEEAPAERCMACHDTDKLAAATAALKPHNPHDSKHWGKKTDCNLCHHQHSRSEDYCASCHEFRFAVP